MNNMDVSKLRNDIVEGMKLSSQKLKAAKKQAGRPVVIIEEGMIKKVEAKDLQ